MKSFILVVIALQGVDSAPYLEAVRQHLASQSNDASVLDGYTYHLKRTVTEVDKNGKSSVKDVEEYDVINNKGLPQRKLVAKNGKPLSAKAAAEQKYEPVRRQPSSKEAVVEAKEVAEEVSRIMNLTVRRREMVGSRAAVVVGLSPRKDASPRTSRGKELLSRIEGEVWVDETDHVLSRLFFRYIEGAGGNPVIGAEKGGEQTVEWLKFRNEVWLPAYSEKRFTLRFFFGKRLPIVQRDDYSEYKKFDSETTIKVVD
jgi:hypothetical protein